MAPVVDASDSSREHSNKHLPRRSHARSRSRFRSRSRYEPRARFRSRSRSRSQSISSVASMASNVGNPENARETKGKQADIVCRLDILRLVSDHPGSGMIQNVDITLRSDEPFDLTLQTDISPIERAAQDKSQRRRQNRVLEVVQAAFDDRAAAESRFWRKHDRSRLSNMRITRIFPTALEIHSLHLERALRALVSYYPAFQKLLVGGLRASQLNYQCLQFPYPVLMHHFSEICDFCADPSKTPVGESDTYDPDLAVKHMVILRDFLREVFDSTVVPLQVQLRRPTPVIQFDQLWYLFQPGRDVYVQDSENVHLAVVEEVYSLNPAVTVIWAWYLSTDGRRIARSQKEVALPKFDDTREVTKLPICPVDVWDASDNGERRRKLLSCNRLIFEALGKGAMHLQFDGSDQWTGQEYHGKVVVDVIRGREHFDTMPWSHGAAVPPGGTPQLGIAGEEGKYTSYDYLFANDTYRDAPLLLNAPSGPGMGTQLPPRGATFGTGPYPIPTPRSRNPFDDTDQHASSAVPTYRPYIGRPPAPPDPSDYPPNPFSPIPPRDPPIYPSRMPSYFEPQLKEKYAASVLAEHQILLLYPCVPAFALATKQWLVINSAQTKTVESSDESIRNLSLVDPEALSTIKALSSRHSRDQRTWSADFVQGKGSGQIILLHGPPGVGKTYTVESIAAWLQRPLIPLTVADIGTSETRIEQELMRWFDLAETWNAILLVDEADIFLEQRKNRDLARNGLVTAFLRRMEYFRGLLFLTTNRVGQIDDAFMSRVHVAFGYDKLTPAIRRAIWTGFLDKLARERKGSIHVGPSARRYVLDHPEVQAIDLNGRDIRNALQSALTLAEYEAMSAAEGGDGQGSEGGKGAFEGLVVVEEGHFRRVLQLNEKFKTYVRGIRHEDEAKRANVRGDRNDYPE